MIKKFVFSLFLFSALLCFTDSVSAADPKLTIRLPDAYSARYISQSIPDPIVMEAGSQKTVVVRFQNTGSATWDASSRNYISAYSVEPKYRESLFRGSTWKSALQTGKISGTVAPGAIGELSIDLSAPQTVGEYTEEFHLASENTSWVNKGYFFLKIRVVPKTSVQAPKKQETIQPETVKTSEPIPYSAKRVIQNKSSVTAEGGELIKLIVSFKNTGATTWKSYAVIAPDFGNISAGESQGNFADESWVSERVLFKKIKAVAAGNSVRETFYIRAPKNQGTYSAKFILQADSTPIPDALVDLNIEVTKNAPKDYREPRLSSDTIGDLQLFRLEQVPRIRVGLWKIEKPESESVEFLSHESDYRIFDGEEVLGTLLRGQQAELSYQSGVYSLKVGKDRFQAKNYIRLAPLKNPDAVFSIPNFTRTISWHKGVNFDAYRGAMEYRLTDDKKSLYVINDLPLEDYVYGIAETSNGTHIEYIKALQTAARTYAYYITEHTNKYPNGNFDVVGDTRDQLYLGYKNEALRPRVVEATKQTRGYLISFDVDQDSKTPDEVVITPYFGNSDGSTRSWKQVWGGTDKPWLVPVVADYDKRDKKSMYGHGVGMSQRDAMIRADEDQLDFQQLLKYYYSGVQVSRWYE